MFADQALELEGVIGFSGGQKKKTNTLQRAASARSGSALTVSLSLGGRGVAACAG